MPDVGEHRRSEERALSATLATASASLLSRQRPGGAWRVDCNAGPATTAYVTVVLRFLRRLDDQQAEANARWLESAWLGPGRGFEGYPGAGEGDLGATAAIWAALHACGRGHDSPALADARRFVADHGGEAALLTRFRQGDLAALFLAMAGLFPAERLPAPPPALAIPGIERAIELRVNVILPFTLQATGAIIRYLRTGAQPLAPGGGVGRLARALEARHTLAHFQRYHNADGSWLYGDCYHAALVLAAMFSLGVAEAHPDFAAGLRFLAGKRRPGHYPIFDTDVWTTAFVLRALLQAGRVPGEAPLSRAVRWLCDCQRNGAWAFQQANTTMPDCDDAAVVIAALAMATDPGRTPGLPPALQARARSAIQAGRQWLFRRQNRDGGWASFQAGLPGKGRGPIMTSPPSPPGDDLWSHLAVLREAPPELGDPATEDVTGRVLFGLGGSGSRAADQEIGRALAFLQNLQDTNGGWWGRWTINYLAASAWVLRGAAAVGADGQAPWLARGLRFLLDHQNPDGGWGETAASYRDLDRIGCGPSTPGLTGLVLSALLDVGLAGDHPAVGAARRFLLAALGDDGTWPSRGELHALLPPRLFYELPETENQLPLEALGLLQRQAGATADALRSSNTPRDRWSAARLEHLRAAGDPLADRVVGELAASGELGQINGLFRMLIHSGDPLPAELPPVAQEFFRSSAALPDWTDPLRLEQAEGLFARHGFSVATALFCSSLPQCFAFPDGARVLGATSSFERDARRRLLETAQFIFDVASPPGLSPDGRGVRAAQKVRLMHAAVRLHLGRRGWDTAGDGVPINQQQLLGTMLSFSLLVTDALRALGFQVRDDEAEAWFHLWRVTGVLLGIDPDHLPEDLADGERLMGRLRDQFWARSSEGISQAHATLAVMQQALPGRQFAGLPAALVRHLAGDRCADLLELPRAPWSRWFVRGGAFLLDSALPRSLIHTTLMAEAQQLAFAMMRALGDVNTGDRPVEFHVPEGLSRPPRHS